MKIIDMHCDTISCLYKNQDIELYQNSLSVDILKLQKGEYMAQCFAMFIPYTTQHLFKTCVEMIDVFKNQIQKNEAYIQQAFTYKDILTISNQNKIAAILTIEEGAVIENDFNKLQYLYDLGVRMITLTWNYKNGIGHPNFEYIKGQTIDFSKVNEVDGLTAFGIELIKKMNELGIIIDVSHLSDKGVYDVLKYSTKPFVASHSNARSICMHCRNLSDDLIAKMAKKRCVIGINYCADFVSLPNNKQEHITYVKDLIKHIKHLVKIGGIDIVALGSDFDGISYNLEMKDCSMLSLLIIALKDEGYSDEDIAKITHQNVLRVFKENLK